MLRIKLSIFAALMTFSFFSKSQEVNNKAFDLMLSGLLSHSVDEVSVKKAKADTTAVFIDAREKNEYKTSHIKNAVWVGYESLNLKPLNNMDKDKEIIVYCSVGYRSEKVAEKIKEKGFTNVKNLYGGIFEWVNQGNTVYSPEGNPTKDVHAYNKTWGIWLSEGDKKYD